MSNANTHMDHFEDRFVIDGNNPLILVDKIIDGEVSFTRKWDGAPSIFLGRDRKGIYIARKGIFNKTPILYYTDNCIVKDLGESALSSKLMITLDVLKDTKIKVGQLFQGDLLFNRGDISPSPNDDGYHTFQPNTIVYGTKEDITGYWVGIVWHTEYKNKKVLKYGGDIKSKIGDAFGLYHFNASDEIAPIDNRTVQLLKYMRKEASQIIAGAETKWSIYDLDDKTRQLWVQFINHKIKAREFWDDFNFFEEYYYWCREYIQELASKFKKLETRSRKRLEYKPVIDDIPKMERVGHLHSILYRMKMVILENLNSASSMVTYLKTSKGFTPTSHEGYVVIDDNGIDAVKIIDRQEFSYANFSPDVIKGWKK
jgi:hypothetical protein